ncbi:amine oxidase [Cooperia oncophora]
MSIDISDESSIDYDVIVVGAGLAGLSAAREVLKLEPTLRVLVLEAKERVGGRTLSVPMKAARGGSLKAELGGTWVCNEQRNILQLIEELGLITIPQYSNGIKWAQLGTPGWRPYTNSRPMKSIWDFSTSEVLNLWWNVRKMEKLAEKVDVKNPFSWPQASKLDEISLAHWIRQNVTGRGAQDALEVAARATYGVEPNKHEDWGKWVNMLYHLALCKSTGTFSNLINIGGGSAQAMRVEGGTEQICKRLAVQIGKNRIILNRAVEQIEVDEQNGVTRVHTYSTNATGEKIMYTCSQVICAVPLNQCARISFSPPLPHLKQQLFESCLPGSMIKFVIAFETAFWREEGWSGEVVSTGRTTTPNEVLPVNCTFDYTSIYGIPALVGFMNEGFTDMTKEDRCNAVVNDLMRVFGERSHAVTFLRLSGKVWRQEPFMSSAHEFVSPV